MNIADLEIQSLAVFSERGSTYLSSWSSTARPSLLNNSTNTLGAMTSIAFSFMYLARAKPCRSTLTIQCQTQYPSFDWTLCRQIVKHMGNLHVSWSGSITFNSLIPVCHCFQQEGSCFNLNSSGTPLKISCCLKETGIHPSTDLVGILSKTLEEQYWVRYPIKDEVVLDLSLMIGTGDGGQGRWGGDIGSNNIRYQQNYINGPQHIQVAHQINYSASQLKGDLSSSFAIFV